MDVGKLAPAGEDAGREASEWKLQQRREGEEERWNEVEEPGVGGEELLFPPTPSFIASSEEE